MFIAFEGPDNVGKSTSAARLDAGQQPTYNITKEVHAENALYRKGQSMDERLMPTTYDRIDWFSHMVYRLALPDHEWNDERPRTVFAMPDTHLVVKLHRPDLAQYISDELYETGTLAQVNPMYWYFAEFLMNLNKVRGYSLFKSVSIMEVANDPRDGTFTQSLKMFDSQTFGGWADDALLSRVVNDDESLLDHLQRVEQEEG